MERFNSPRKISSMERRLKMTPFRNDIRWKIRKRQSISGAICSTVALTLLFGLTSFTLAGQSGKNDLKGVKLKDVTFTGSRQGQAVGFVDIDGDGIDDAIVSAALWRGCG